MSEQQPTVQTAPETVEGAVRWRDGEVNIHHGATALVTMACCGFTFSAEHTGADGGYSCPICGPAPAASGAGAETLRGLLQKTAGALVAATARADRAEEALRDVLVGCETMLHSGPNLKYRQWFETYSKFISAALRSSASTAAATEEAATSTGVSATPEGESDGH